MDLRLKTVERRNDELRHSLEAMMRMLEEGGQRTARIESAVEDIRVHLNRVDDRAYQQWIRQGQQG